MVRARLSPWFLLLPSLIVMAAVIGYPLLRTFYFSFTDAQLASLDTHHWAGFSNFKRLVTDLELWSAARVTLIFTVASVAIETALGLGFALVMNSAFRGRRLVRAVVLIPWAIPTVIAARMWAWMFNDLYGMINALLLKWGWISRPIAWLAEAKLSLLAVVVVDVWKTTPFMALLLLAGLQTIPQNLYEVARVDGVSTLKSFFKITLPLLRPAILVAVVFRLLDALRIFDLPFVLTSNNPSTRVLSIFAHQQLVDFQNIGYGSAVSIGIFIFIACIALIYIQINQQAWKAFQ
jgi:trehalose/maltose transport system permease protein